jgi:hypothetical protein
VSDATVRLALWLGADGYHDNINHTNASQSQAADADEVGRVDAKDVAIPRPDSKLEPVRDASRPTTSAQSGA